VENSCRRHFIKKPAAQAKNLLIIKNIEPATTTTATQANKVKVELIKSEVRSI